MIPWPEEMEGQSTASVAQKYVYANTKAEERIAPFVDLRIPQNVCLVLAYSLSTGLFFLMRL